MKLFVLLSLLAYSFSLFSGGGSLALSEESFPNIPFKESKKNTVLISHTKGLVLVASYDEIAKGGIEREGFHVIGMEIPGGEMKLEKKLLPLFFNRSLTALDIEKIQDAIRDYYHSYHRPFVVVDVPNQDVTSGVLQIVVFESALSEVKIQGNQWTSTERLKRYLHLKPGRFINQKSLLDDLDFINRNPFRRADIVYAPGEKEGTTDVILHVEDRRPLRFYAGAENTGVPTTHRQRWFTGFNWGNAFGFDHILAYQYTSSYNPHRFQAHTMQYIAPLPWHHVLDVYTGASWVEADLGLPSMRSKGFSFQASGRYKIPFLIGVYLRQEAILGFDFKRTNNTIEFVDDYPTFGKNANLTQIVLEYGGIYERKSYRLDFEGSVYWSPGEWVADQTDKDYESLRPGAKNHWIYFKGAIAYLQRLPKSFSLHLLASGQFSPYNLLPSEQFGLGGYDTVRGYDMRELSVESGLLLSGEVRSPALPLFHHFKWIKQVDAIQFLAFIDYGYGRYKKMLPFEEENQYLMSIGPGLRYTLEPYFTARLDWGIKLKKKAMYGGGDSMVHFSVTGSF